MDPQGGDHKIPFVPTTDPQTLHSNLSSDNANSLDWSCASFLSFGCYSRVIIVDLDKDLSIIQTLTKHKAHVNRTKWMPADCRTLLTADVKDHIIIWDTIEGHPLTVLAPDTREAKNLIDLAWIKKDKGGKNELQYNVLCLYQSSALILYDSEEGNIIWKKSLTIPRSDCNAKSFHIDPFSCLDLAVSFTSNSVPLSSVNSSSGGSSPSQISSPGFSSFAIVKDYCQPKLTPEHYTIFQRNNDLSPKSPLSSSSTSGKLEYVVERILGPNSLKYDNDPLIFVPEFLQVRYNNSTINQLLILLSRKMLIVDLRLCQVICIIPFERNASSAIDFYSCWQRNLIITLHDSATIVARLAHKSVKKDPGGVDLLNLSYKTLCSSDGLRITKHSKICSFAVSAASEIFYALLANSGKLFIHKLHRKSAHGSKVCHTSLSDMIEIQEYRNKNCNQYSLIMKNIMGSLSLGPHVIRMCPPITVRNWQSHHTWVAIGDSTGGVIIYNTSTRTIEKEIDVHSAPVRGIEWASLGFFLSYAYQNPSRQSGKVFNELNVTEISTGRSESIRADRLSDCSPIEMLRISHLKQYFIIVFKSDPLEIWDLKKLTLLRVLSKVLFHITALEWSYFSSSKKESTCAHDGVSPASAVGSNATKEDFLLTNSDCELFHFSVAGNAIKQISSTSDMSFGNKTSIAWKNDVLVLGDTDGNINVWYLKGKGSKTIPNDRGWIKKMRFSPGKGNLKCLVLYSDGVDIFDLKELKICATLKQPRDISYKVHDIDWASSDRPILSSADGSLYIMDSSLKQCTCPLRSDSFRESSGSYYHILPPMSKFIAETRFLHRSDRSERYAGCDVNRCISYYRSVGDIESLKFWELICHHLFPTSSPLHRALDACYDLHLNRESFKFLYKERICLYEAVRATSANNHKCCEYHIWSGNYSRAVQLLLETEPSGEPDDQNFYIDSLKACLISLLSSPDGGNSNSHPVLKLVATNLIANGNISEGVQLLYLIGKCLDACRYLQSYNLWEESLLVAKMNLTDEESSSLINNWLNHLKAKNFTSKILFTLLSVKLFYNALEILYNEGDLRKAALLTDLCIEHKVLDISGDSSELLRKIYRAYSEKLSEAGCKVLSAAYAEKASSIP